MLCANAGGRHMHSRKLHPCPGSALYFPIKLWSITNILNFKPKLSCFIPSRSQALVNVSVCCCLCLFSSFFYCETTARDSVCHLVEKPIMAKWLQCACATSTYKVCTVTKIVWCAYYSDDEICVMHTVRCPSRTHKKWSILWALGVNNNI